MLTKVLSFTLLGAMTLPLVFGQTDAARMTGTVTDASGAVIPAASVTVKNEKTGQVRQVTTDEHGVYLAPQLPPSIYSLTAAAPGMATAEFRGVSLQVGQERTLNIALSPASMTTEVNVSGGELVTVDVSSARIGANVSIREVAELPMNGRQVSQLYLLAPGAVNNGSGSFDNIRFSGRSNQQNVIRFQVREPNSTICSTLSPPGKNLRIDTVTPHRAMGGRMTWMREPSGSRASNRGRSLDSGRPTNCAMLRAAASRPSSVKTASVFQSLPRSSTQTSAGPLMRISLNRGSSR